MDEQELIEACKMPLKKIAERVFNEHHNQLPNDENIGSRYDVDIVRVKNAWEVEVRSTDPDADYSFPNYMQAIRQRIAGISEVGRGSPGRVINDTLVFDNVKDIALALNAIATSQEEKIDIGDSVSRTGT